MVSVCVPGCSDGDRLGGFFGKDYGRGGGGAAELDTGSLYQRRCALEPHRYDPDAGRISGGIFSGGSPYHGCPVHDLFFERYH